MKHQVIIAITEEITAAVVIVAPLGG